MKNVTYNDILFIEVIFFYILLALFDPIILGFFFNGLHIVNVGDSSLISI